MASALIGALRATLGLDSAAFEKGATKAQAKAAGMQKSMGGLGTSMGTLGRQLKVVNGLVGALGVTMGVTAGIRLGRAVLQNADDLATAADQTGVAVERFQTLKEAFRVLE